MAAGEVPVEWGRRARRSRCPDCGRKSVLCLIAVEKEGEQAEAMNVEKAVALVVADQRESYPELSEQEAIDHVRQTVNPDELYDYGDDLYHAYTMVFSPEFEELRDRARGVGAGERR